MRIITSIVLLFLLFPMWVSAQLDTWVVNAPSYFYTSSPTIMLEKIELTKEYTITYWRFKNTDSEQTYIEAANTFWIADGWTRVAKLVKTKGIPLTKMRGKKFECANPKTSKIIKPGEVVHFQLYFTPIPAGLNRINLVEYDGRQSCEFDVWGIDIAQKKKLKTKEEAPIAQKVPPAKVTPSTPPKPATKVTPSTTTKVEPTPSPKVNNALTLAGAPPNNMVILIDVSFSMGAPKKLPLLKESIKKLVSLMRPEDNISIVSFANEGKVLLPSTKATNREAIYNVLDAIKTGGTTNAGQGIRLAYQVANQNFKDKGNNKIIIATDGEFNVPQNLLTEASKNADKGIKLSIFQFAGLQSKSLKQLSDSANGNYQNISETNVDAVLVGEAK